LNQRIAAVNQAEVFPAPMLQFLPVLESFGLETLGDVQHFIDENSEAAYQLALSQLAITDLDIISESIGLQNLCLAYVLKNGDGIAGLKSVYDLLYGKQDNNNMLAEMMYEQASHLPFVKK
jgi:hypothetical protein